MLIPASDDIWTSKLGTRVSVYEVYLIQELNRKPISKKGKAFVRLGYQYDKFDYTGSNNWVGAPVKISDLSTTNPATQQMLAPLKDVRDLYLTFDVLYSKLQQTDTKRGAAQPLFFLLLKGNIKQINSELKFQDPNAKIKYQ